MASEQTADSTTMKNKIKDIVMEIAMIKQAMQAKDLGFFRDSVIENLQKINAHHAVTNNPAAVISSNELTQ